MCVHARAYACTSIHPCEGVRVCVRNGRAQVDCNFDGKVSFLEYLLYQYRKAPTASDTPT